MPSPESFEIRKQIQKDQINTELSMSQKRQIWEQYAESLPISEEVILTYEIINGVKCLWISNSKSLSEEIIYYIHGGGLVEGSIITHREFASRLNLGTLRSVLLIDYSLAPEHPYPAALEDVESVYKELIKKRFAPEHMVWGGDSSGASLALSSIIRLRDNNVPLPQKVFFLSGLFDHSLSGESYITRETIDPFTSKDVLFHCNKMYCSELPLDSPEISPLFNDLSNLPECLFQVGDHEILLSDSVRLFEKLKPINENTELEVWDSMWHSWHMYIDLPEANEAINKIKHFLDKR